MSRTSKIKSTIRLHTQLTQIGDLAGEDDGVPELGGDLLPPDQELRLQLLPLQTHSDSSGRLQLGLRGGLDAVRVLVGVGRVQAAAASSIVPGIGISLSELVSDEEC